MYIEIDLYGKWPFSNGWVLQRDSELCWKKSASTVLNVPFASQMLDIDNNSMFSSVANITIRFEPESESGNRKFLLENVLMLSASN